MFKGLLKEVFCREIYIDNAITPTIQHTKRYVVSPINGSTTHLHSMARKAVCKEKVSTLHLYGNCPVESSIKIVGHVFFMAI